MAKWPFADAEKTATYTLRSIVFGGEPILHVVHDDEDGAWQFLGWESPRDEDIMIIGLAEILTFDASIGELANLPLGWEAFRRKVSEPWEYSPIDT